MNDNLNDGDTPDATTPLPESGAGPTTEFETPDPATVLGPDQPGGLGTGLSTAPEPPSSFDLPPAPVTTTWNEPPAGAWEQHGGRSDTLTEPAPVAAPHAATERRPFRMRTLVLGLILLVVAGAVLLAQLTTVSIDPGVVVLGLMVGAGLMLIAGAARS